MMKDNPTAQEAANFFMKDFEKDRADRKKRHIELLKERIVELRSRIQADQAEIVRRMEEIDTLKGQACLKYQMHRLKQKKATATEIRDAIGITPDDVAEAKEAIRKAEWSDTFPQEEGWYWFFGQDFGPKHRDEIIRLHTVKVHRIQNGYTYICDGHFIYPSEAVGVWLPMTLPEFPKE